MPGGSPGCPRVVVLGAGLTGVGVALELAHRGVAVTLVDQDPWPMNRASLRNEGKIHLGFIYAADKTLSTARLQLMGALRFRALLSRWIGSRADRLRRSTPFFYLVARDSLLSVEALDHHYAAVQSLYREGLAQAPEHDYLGERPEALYAPCPLDRLGRWFDVGRFAGAFRTEERAIDTGELAALLREAVKASPRIRFLPRHRVLAVGRTNGGLRIEGEHPGGRWRLEADQVVNALWENRLAIDRTVGLAAEPGWVHRLKYRVIARLPGSLRGAPSATMVLGRYGDVVVRPDGTAYLSWYPLGLRGWSHALAPPADWDGPCRGEVSAEERDALARGLLAAIDAWYPGIGRSEPLLVDAGAIVAYGATDVDDPASRLHDRSRIGVTSMDGYHSVDPGKLTTAPFFASLAAERILGTEAKS